MLDDTLSGITFKSFVILDVLGQGTFGKVFRVNLKNDTDPVNNAMAMKVLNK